MVILEVTIHLTLIWQVKERLFLLVLVSIEYNIQPLAFTYEHAFTNRSRLPYDRRVVICYLFAESILRLCFFWAYKEIVDKLLGRIFCSHHMWLFSGQFSLDDTVLDLTICPRHRDEYGLRWMSNKKTCACPSDWAPHKTTSRKGDRGITLQQSHLLYNMTSTVVPVASREYICQQINCHLINKILRLSLAICKRCRLLLVKNKESLKTEQVAIKISPASSLTHSSEGEATEEKTSTLAECSSSLSVSFGINSFSWNI